MRTLGTVASLKWAFRGSSAATAWAALLDSLQPEPDGMVLLFTDPDYPRALIRDTTTPANAVDTDANSVLTYTSPALKRVLKADGLLKYEAHNLFLNSASPATQNITVVSGALMKVIVTGSGSLAMTSAGSGTASSGSPASFTTTGTTLTCTLTGSLTTVQVFYAPADETYVATTGAARYRLPVEYDTAGDPVGLLVEEARTELTLYNRDFSNAAWTKSNMTAAKTATGVDGVANSASTLTATAGNATVLQAITSASAARITGCRIKRRTGTGNIDLTQDNGSTWTTVTVTSSWTRVNIASVTSTNPTVGIRIVTSGDAIDVDFFTHQVGAFLTSDIATTSATVTRAADNISLATSAMPYSATVGTVTISAKSPPFNAIHTFWSFDDAGGAAERWGLYRNDVTQLLPYMIDGSVGQTSMVSGTVAINTNFKHAFAWAANDLATVLDGASAVTDASATIPTVTLFKIGISNNGQTQPNSHIKYLIYRKRRVTNADMQTDTAA